MPFLAFPSRRRLSLRVHSFPASVRTNSSRGGWCGNFPDLAKSINALFIEASALDGTNVAEAFETIAKQISKQHAFVNPCPLSVRAARSLTLGTIVLTTCSAAGAKPKEDNVKKINLGDVSPRGGGAAAAGQKKGFARFCLV